MGTGAGEGAGCGGGGGGVVATGGRAAQPAVRTIARNRETKKAEPRESGNREERGSVTPYPAHPEELATLFPAFVRAVQPLLAFRNIFNSQIEQLIRGEERSRIASTRDSGYYRHAKFYEQGDAVPLPVRWRYKIDRWRSQIAGLFHSEPKQQRPRLCPACGTLVGATATKCHQCGASMTFSFAAASKSLSRWMPQTSPVTYAMLAICCVMYGLAFVITMKLSGMQGVGGGIWNLGGVANQVNLRLGESLPLYVNLRQPWRFVTAIFLHASLIHIGFNMWVLMDIGPMVEELYGSARYLFLYVATGVVGYLLSSFVGHFSVGASGSLLGLIGVLLAATTGRKSMAAQNLRGVLIRWLIYIAILGFLFSGTDNYAHFGGVVSGYLLGRFMPDRTPADLSERRRADLLGWTTGIAVAVSFVFMVVSYLQTT